jgi:hypothetical protein
MGNKGISYIRSQKQFQRKQAESREQASTFQQLSTLLRLCDELAVVIGGGRAYNDLAENEHAGWL